MSKVIKGRSLIEQRKRLLKKESLSTQYSTKYIQKKVIYEKYALKENREIKQSSLLIIILSSLFFLILTSYLSNFLIGMFISGFVFILGNIIDFLRPKIKNTKLEIMNCNVIFEKYDAILSIEMKQLLQELNLILQKIEQANLHLSNQYYIKSTLNKDIPELLDFYKNISEEKKLNAQESIVRQLQTIVLKIKEILFEQDNLNLTKIAIKEKVIIEKANN